MPDTWDDFPDADTATLPAAKSEWDDFPDAEAGYKVPAMEDGPAPEGMLDSAWRALKHELPASTGAVLGGLAGGAVAGAMTGGASGSVVPGWGTAAVGLGGAVLGGLGGAYAAQKAFNATQEQEALDAEKAQLAANTEANPVTTSAASLLGILPSMAFGGGAAKTATGVTARALGLGAKESAAAVQAARAAGPLDAAAVRAAEFAGIAKKAEEKVFSLQGAGIRALQSGIHGSATMGSLQTGQQMADEGLEAIKNAPDNFAHNAVAMAATGIFPHASTILGQVLGKPVKDSAAMALAGAAYELAKGHDVNSLDVVKHGVEGIPGFIMLNALGALTHRISAPKATPPPAAPPAAGIPTTPPAGAPAGAAPVVPVTPPPVAAAPARYVPLTADEVGAQRQSEDFRRMADQRGRTGLRDKLRAEEEQSRWEQGQPEYVSTALAEPSTIEGVPALDHFSNVMEELRLGSNSVNPSDPRNVSTRATLTDDNLDRAENAAYLALDGVEKDTTIHPEDASKLTNQFERVITDIQNTRIEKQADAAKAEARKIQDVASRDESLKKIDEDAAAATQKNEDDSLKRIQLALAGRVTARPVGNIVNEHVTQHEELKAQTQRDLEVVRNAATAAPAAAAAAEEVIITKKVPAEQRAIDESTSERFEENAAEQKKIADELAKQAEKQAKENEAKTKPVAEPVEPVTPDAQVPAPEVSPAPEPVEGRGTEAPVQPQVVAPTEPRLSSRSEDDLHNTSIGKQKEISNWLHNGGAEPSAPDTIYRGVPKGAPFKAEGKWTHATPWGSVAARGGKGAFGMPRSEYDIHELPAGEDTIYYRGGALADSPLERTRIMNASGMTWKQILDSARKIFDTRKARIERVIDKSNPDYADYSDESIETIKKNAIQTLANEVVNDVRVASFETDALGQKGRWSDKKIPSRANRPFPKMMTDTELAEFEKSPAQVVEDASTAQAEPVKQAPVIKRAKDFADSGEYDIHVGGVDHKIFRDPEGGWQATTIKAPMYQPGGSQFKWLGWTKAEAIKRLTELAEREAEKKAAPASPGAATEVAAEPKPTSAIEPVAPATEAPVSVEKTVESPPAETHDKFIRDYLDKNSMKWSDEAVGAADRYLNGDKAALEELKPLQRRHAEDLLKATLTGGMTPEAVEAMQKAEAAAEKAAFEELKRGRSTKGKRLSFLNDPQLIIPDERMKISDNKDGSITIKYRDDVTRLEPDENGPLDRGYVNAAMNYIKSEVDKGLDAPKEEATPKIPDALLEAIEGAGIKAKKRAKRTEKGFVITSPLHEAIDASFKAAQDFTNWSREMLAKLGRKITPFLHDIWNYLKGALKTPAGNMEGGKWKGGERNKGFFAGPASQMSKVMSDSLITARAMAAAGKTSEEIRSITGWFPGIGKGNEKLRYEVPDNKMRWKGPLSYDDAKKTTGMESPTFRLGDVLDHKGLEETYPDFFRNGPGKISVSLTRRLVPGEAEYISPGAIDIGVSSSGRLDPEKISNVLLHEIQHHIQEKEGFAKGGSPDNLVKPQNLTEASRFRDAERGLADAENEIVSTQEALDEERSRKSTLGFGGPNKTVISKLEGYLNSASQKIEDIWAYQGKQGIPRGSAKAALLKTLNQVERELGVGWMLKDRQRGLVRVYQKLAGEIEARDVQARQNLTDEQRASTAPYSSENIAPEDAIVMFGGEGRQASEGEARPVAGESPLAERRAPIATEKNPFTYKIHGLIKDRDGVERWGGGRTTIARDGTIPITPFEKNLSDREAKIYRSLVPEAFTEGRVNVKMLDEKLRDLPAVEVHSYGQNGNESEAKKELDKMTHDWFEPLHKMDQQAVKLYSEGVNTLEGSPILDHLAPSLHEKAKRFKELKDKTALEDEQYDGPKATGYYESISPLDTKKHPVKRIDVVLPTEKDSTYTTKQIENRRRLGLDDGVGGSGKKTPLWVQDNTHENLPNTLGWAMVQEVTRNGERVWVIGEMQAEWAKAKRLHEEWVKSGGKEGQESYRGYKPHMDHPLLSKWETLTLNAVLDQARRAGVKKVILSDGETAMMTEKHDQLHGEPDLIPGTYNLDVERLRKNISDATGKVIIHDANTLGIERADGSLWDVSRQSNTYPKIQDLLPKIEGEARVNQSSGMRAQYDQRGPDILKKLTGSRGQEVDLGVHKNAALNENDLLAGIKKVGDQYVTEDGVAHRTKRAAIDHLKATGKFGSPVFKDASGKPKTNITGREYTISNKADSGIRYSRPTEEGSLRPAQVERTVRDLGLKTGEKIKVVNEPDADWNGRYNADGSIELNAAHLKDEAAVRSVLNHESVHDALETDSTMKRDASTVLDSLTDSERQTIEDTLGAYEEGAKQDERLVEAVRKLAEANPDLAGRFNRFVRTVKLQLKKFFGSDVSREFAELTAAKILARGIARAKAGTMGGNLSVEAKYMKVPGFENFVRAGKAFKDTVKSANKYRTEALPWIKEVTGLFDGANTAAGNFARRMANDVDGVTKRMFPESKGATWRQRKAERAQQAAADTAAIAVRQVLSGKKFTEDTIKSLNDIRNLAKNVAPIKDVIKEMKVLSRDVKDGRIHMKDAVKILNETIKDAEAGTIGVSDVALMMEAAINNIDQRVGTKAYTMDLMDQIKARGKDYTSKIKNFDQVHDLLKNRWDDLEKIAEAAKKGTDAVLAALKAAGIDVDAAEGYVKGLYVKPDDFSMVFDSTRSQAGSSTSFKKAKVYNNYLEAILDGMTPKGEEMSLRDLTFSAANAGLGRVNHLEWQNSLKNFVMPDGNEILKDLDAKGNAPIGYQKVTISPGKSVAIHEQMAPVINDLSTASAWPEILSEAGGFIKHNMLAFDVYHLARFGMMGAAFTRKFMGYKSGYKKGLHALDYSKEGLVDAVHNGEVTQADADWANANRADIDEGVRAGFNSGKISDALFNDVFYLLKGVKTANKYIFEKYSRGIMAQAYVHALKQNTKENPQMNRRQVVSKTVKDVNTYFRSLGNQGLFTNKTFQDMSRNILFAPQWFEGGVKSDVKGVGQIGKGLVGQGFGPVGSAMATGLIASLAIAQVVNMMTRGHPTWENEEPGHELDVWIPDKISGSGGYFISPLSVFNETAHDAIKYTEKGQSLREVSSTIISNKLHPLSRSMKTFFGGEDFAGRKLKGMDVWMESGKAIIPIPLAAQVFERKGAPQKQALSLLGQKAEHAPSATNNVYALIDKWKRDKGIKVHEFGESPYRKLRNAIMNDDASTAKVEYLELLNEKDAKLIDEYFEKYPTKPLTGSADTEAKFMRTLNLGQRRLYRESVSERKKVASAFLRVKRASGRRSP